MVAWSGGSGDCVDVDPRSEKIGDTNLRLRVTDSTSVFS